MTGKRGNPNWEQNPAIYKTNRPEARMKTLQVRIEPSLLERLKQIPNWQDLIRDRVADIVEEQGPGIPEHLRGEVY